MSFFDEYIATRHSHSPAYPPAEAILADIDAEETQSMGGHQIALPEGWVEPGSIFDLAQEIFFLGSCAV